MVQRLWVPLREGRSSIHPVPPRFVPRAATGPGLSVSQRSRPSRRDVAPAPGPPRGTRTVACPAPPGPCGLRRTLSSLQPQGCHSLEPRDGTPVSQLGPLVRRQAGSPRPLATARRPSRPATRPLPGGTAVGEVQSGASPRPGERPGLRSYEVTQRRSLHRGRRTEDAAAPGSTRTETSSRAEGAALPKPQNTEELA